MRMASPDYLITTMAGRRQKGWSLLAGLAAGFAALMAYLLLSGTVSGRDRTGGVLVAVGFVLVFVYSFRRATRFRIAREADEQAGSLRLEGRRWGLVLRPEEVRRIVRLRTDPYSFGFWATRPSRSWRRWFSVEFSGGRGRRYLFYRIDAEEFMGRLRAARFAVEREGAGDGSDTPGG